MDEVTEKLYGTTDAQVWAEEFIKVVTEKPELATDFGFVVGWFANAMEIAKVHAERMLGGPGGCTVDTI